IPRREMRRRAFLKGVRELLLRKHRIVGDGEVLRDAREVCPVRKRVTMLGGPLLGEPAAEWQRRERSPGAEKRGAPALLDAVQEQFPVAGAQRTLHDRAK